MKKPTAEQLKSPYWQGYNAAINKKRRKSNPYQSCTKRFIDWDFGFLKVKLSRNF